MIRLSLSALSLYGKKVTNSLRTAEHELNRHCSCPPGESCSVEVTELPGRQFEVIVKRPQPVDDSESWSEIQAGSGTYRKVFDKRTTAWRIRYAVTKMVGAPLLNSGLLPAELRAPGDQNFVLIDAVQLQEARRQLVGCQMCSPFANIPFAGILDRVTAQPAPTQYILEEPVQCPRCFRPVNERTLVEFEPPQEANDLQS